MKKDFEESVKENIEELDIATNEEMDNVEPVKRAEHPEAAVSAILFAMGDSKSWQRRSVFPRMKQESLSEK